MDMVKKTPLVKIAQNGKMRSSPQARRLIRAYVKKYKSQHKAAKRLNMTQAQLNGMLSGRLRDNAAMQVALSRADERARRAWSKIDNDQCTVIDAPATLRAALRALQQAETMIAVLSKESER